MKEDLSKEDSGEFTFTEREATAVFPDEISLDRAVDALMQLGLRQEDMSVFAHSAHLAATGSAEEIADKSDATTIGFTSPDSRTEMAAALVGTPALLTGLGAALAISTAGVAMIPAIVVTAGSALLGGGAGMIFARIFGQKHASYIQEQISNGGIVLWVRTHTEQQDNAILKILAENGGKNPHIHMVNRQWGVSSIPFHDVQPDPLLRS